MVPVEPMVLELANAMLPLKVAGVALALYRALPLTPAPLSVKLLALLKPFRSKAPPVLTVDPLATPLSAPINFKVLLAFTVIDPVDPAVMLGKSVVFGVALELATLTITVPLSVTTPAPRVPVPAALPIWSEVPV